MSNMNVIDFAEWTAALEAVQKSQPERKGLTSQEICEQVGHTKQWVRDRIIQPLIRSGQIECRMVKMRDVSGRLNNRPEYIFKSTATKKKERA